MATDEVIPSNHGLNVFSSNIKQELLPQRSLVRKLAEVMAVVERVPKNGTNQHFGYKYPLYDDIITAVREAMAVRHLILFPNVIKDEWLDVATQRGGKERLCTLTVQFTIEDGDTGEERRFNIIGQGQDVGEKASFKAITGAEKAALMKIFLIPTGDAPPKPAITTPRAPRAAPPPKPVEAKPPQPPLVLDPKGFLDGVKPAEPPKTRKLDLGTEPTGPTRTHEDISFAKGPASGVPLSKLSSENLNWYVDALQKTLDDAGMVLYHKAATYQQACTQAELRYREATA